MRYNCQWKWIKTTSDESIKKFNGPIFHTFNFRNSLEQPQILTRSIQRWQMSTSYDGINHHRVLYTAVLLSFIFSLNVSIITLRGPQPAFHFFRFYISLQSNSFPIKNGPVPLQSDINSPSDLFNFVLMLLLVFKNIGIFVSF